MRVRHEYIVSHFSTELHNRSLNEKAELSKIKIAQTKWSEWK
jgi:hypothetical protein